ncbi:hypothetical protein L1887_29226 [Cichorium endivia]|nr:hypothetical protein L1887_29226 [Cichorium endivia]
MLFNLRPIFLSCATFLSSLINFHTHSLCLLVYIYEVQISFRSLSLAGASEALNLFPLSLSHLHEIDRISRLIVASVVDSSSYRRRRTKRNLLDEHFKKLWWTIYASLYQQR